MPGACRANTVRAHAGPTASAGRGGSRGPRARPERPASRRGDADGPARAVRVEEGRCAAGRLPQAQDGGLCDRGSTGPAPQDGGTGARGCLPVPGRVPRAWLALRGDRPWSGRSGARRRQESRVMSPIGCSRCRTSSPAPALRRTSVVRVPCCYCCARPRRARGEPRAARAQVGSWGRGLTAPTSPHPSPWNAPCICMAFRHGVSSGTPATRGARQIRPFFRSSRPRARFRRKMSLAPSASPEHPHSAIQLSRDARSSGPCRRRAELPCPRPRPRLRWRTPCRRCPR